MPLHMSIFVAALDPIQVPHPSCLKPGSDASFGVRNKKVHKWCTLQLRLTLTQ
jgi:hypothetical protein